MTKGKPDLGEFEELTEAVELRRQLTQTQGKLREVRSGQAALVEAVQEGAKDALMALGPVPPADAPKADKRKGKPEVALWHLTDWQGAKALDDDTPMFTPSGWTRHGDLRPGDEVFGADGKSVRVLAVTGSSEQECFRLRFDGASLVASGDHLWQGWRRYKSGPDNRYERRPLLWTTKQIAALKPTQRENRTYIERAFHVDLPGALELQERDLVVDPYLFGMWLGDGFSAAGRICCGAEDVEHLSQFAEPRHYESQTSSAHVATVPGLQTDLRKLGVLGGKHVPEEYLFSSAVQRLALLQGLMDTDGTCDEKGRASFTNTNRNLADAVAWLATSLGCKTHRAQALGTLNGVAKRMAYRVEFRPHFQAFRLKRKYARQMPSEEGGQSRFRFVQAVESVGLRSAQCLTVEGGLYLAGRDLVLTHNCTTSYNSEVMRDRVLRYCDKAEKLTEIQRADHPVKDAVVLLGGDMMEGLFNFPQQPFEIDATLFAQFASVGRLEAEVVRRALSIYENVQVISEWGNHGRMGNKRAVVPRSDNIDRMAAELAKAIVSTREGDMPERLQWEVSEEDIHHFKIGNYAALLIHGDEIGRNGYASPNTVVGHIKGWKAGAYPKPFKDVYSGHIHQHSEYQLPDGSAFYVTGSPESDNRYARDSMAASSVPSQRLHFIDPSKGRVTGQYKIELV